MRACGWPGCRKGKGLGIRATHVRPLAVSRRLVAVFAADVEGYGRLMGADEVGTLKGLTERRAILDRIIGEHRGRIANTAGDSVLAAKRVARMSSVCPLVPCGEHATL
jgi:class 3 adenylate cyclase